MPPTCSRTKGKKVPPLWWKQRIDDRDKDMIRHAVAVYCFENDLSSNNIGTTKDDLVNVIPTVGKFISKWAGVNAGNFDLVVTAHR